LRFKLFLFAPVREKLMFLAQAQSKDEGAKNSLLPGSLEPVALTLFFML
jgi:hypothetical protein